MSDGPMLGRFRLGTFVVTERRKTVYDGSHREDNPLSERTSITVPIVSLDFRFTHRFGIQGSTTIPLIARTGVVPRALGDLPFRDEVRGLGDTVLGGWYTAAHPRDGTGRSMRHSRCRRVPRAHLASAPNWTTEAWCPCHDSNEAAARSIDVRCRGRTSALRWPLGEQLRGSHSRRRES